MLIEQYAGVGTTCPPIEISAQPGGNLTASGSLYFGFQLGNRAGYNRPFVTPQINYNPGDRLIITIPNFQKPAWDIHYIVVSAGTTSDPSTFVQICRINAFEVGALIEPKSVRRSLPFSFNLDRDAHIALAPTVTTPSSLPTGSDRIDGQIRFISSLNQWRMYVANPVQSDPDAINQTSEGEWVQVASAQSFVDNTFAGIGSDRAITEINPDTTLPYPEYPKPFSVAKSLPGWSMFYWLVNRGDTSIAAGLEFGIDLFWGDRQSPLLFNGLFQVRFLGFAKPDGTYRTTDSEGRDFPNVGGFFTWTPATSNPFITIDELGAGEAIALEVKPFFHPAEVDFRITPGSHIGIIPAIRPVSGDYTPVGKLFPNGIIFQIEDAYRVVPASALNLKILKGTGIVANIDWPIKPERFFSGLTANQAGQKVIINGTGAVFIRPSSYAPTNTEAVRALVSTVAGETATTNWSNPIAIAANTAIEITINHPVNNFGYAKIRSNYPDVIAGNERGLLNAEQIIIYVNNGSQIRAFSYPVVPTPTQVIEIIDFSAGTLINALPTGVAVDFGLYAPILGQVGGGVAGAVNAPAIYRVAAAYRHTGISVTAISHASPPCIEEFPGDFSPPTITIDSVYRLPNNSDPEIENLSNVANHAILRIGIPEGDKGEQGEQGEQGEPGLDAPSFDWRGDWDDENAPYDSRSVVRHLGKIWYFPYNDEVTSLGSDRVPGTSEFWQLLIEPPEAIAVTIGNVQTVAPDQPASVTNTSTDPTEVELSFDLPRGTIIESVSVTTLSAGSLATGALQPTATPGIFVLQLGIPRGSDGSDGIQGIAGPSGSTTAGAVILDTSSAPLSLTSGQIAIRQNNGEIIIQYSDGNEVSLSRLFDV